jgi:hypothetical protein
VEQDRLTKASAEFSEHALERAGSSEQVSRPGLPQGFSVFQRFIESQGRGEVSLEGFDRLGLLFQPSGTEGVVKVNGLGLVFRLPNLSRRAEKVG